MQPDLIQTIIEGAPNLGGMLIAIFILYRIVTKNQDDIQERLTYLEHQNQDIKAALASLMARLQTTDEG